jgi:hypothetical protein
VTAKIAKTANHPKGVKSLLRGRRTRAARSKSVMVMGTPILAEQEAKVFTMSDSQGKIVANI